MSPADAEQRRAWQAAPGRKAFRFRDSTNTRPTVGVMLVPAISLDDLWADAEIVTVGGIDACMASIPHLIKTKAAAGRTQDLVDLERLRAKLTD